MQKIVGLRPRKRQKTEIATESVERPDGWIWQLGKLAKMSDDEMDAWSIEGKCSISLVS